MTHDQIAEFLDALPVAAVLVGASERIEIVNSEARALLGEHVDGRHYATILRQPQVIDALEGTLADRKPRRTRHAASDGAQDSLYDVTCSYVAGVGKGGVLMVFQDVTHLEQAGQMRRDFVANVSHELRTPLTALMGFIETLRGPAREDAEVRERFLKIMDGEASRMNRLVGDLLSLSRVESEERVRPKDRLDLSAYLSSTINSLRPLAESAGVEVTLSVPSEPVMVTGDPDQLLQVFTNLIENAIKYGGSGGKVQVVLTMVERDPAVRTAAARVEVIDNGPGIDPVHLPRLTERFYRADNHRSREMGGTGLGLAIVKHIVNRHRGRLRVESELGQGAVFTVILPV
jgi:two-component system phosphate regulon sensor histidine kinase PhoR